MPRKRMIDPGIWRSEQFNNLARDSRLLFIGIFSNADDAGRLHGSSRFLKANIFPYDDDVNAGKVAKWREDVLNAGLALLYEHEGHEYLYLPTWLRHQRIDRPSPSSLPSYEECSTNTRRTLDEHSSLIEDSIREDSIREEKGDAPTGAEHNDSEDMNPLEEEVASLQSWGKLTQADREWIEQWLRDYPGTIAIDIRDCRDYWMAKPKPHNTKVWKSRLRNWMKRKDTFGGNGRTHGTGQPGNAPSGAFSGIET